MAVRISMVCNFAFTTSGSIGISLIYLVAIFLINFYALIMLFASEKFLVNLAFQLVQMCLVMVC